MTIAPVRSTDSQQLIAESTEELLALADGVPEARRQELLDEVIILNAPVARSIASRYRRKGVDADDLEQVAYLGLVKAANGYRPEASTAFLSYAVPTIRGELKRYFRDCAWTVRPPRRVQEMQGSIAAAEPQLTQQLGHLPTDEETAKALGTDPEEVAEAASVRGVSPRCRSTRRLPPTPARAWSKRWPTPRTGTSWSKTSTLWHPPSRISMIGTGRSWRCGSVAGSRRRRSGTSLGVSQMQVSRLLRGILDRLREDLTKPTG